MGNYDYDVEGNAFYYGRVSTISDEQKDSLENQRKLRDHYLSRHPNLRCVRSYEEQISGKSDQRPKFSKMLLDIESSNGTIRYIMVKDTKRLFRSTEVAAKFKNFAKKYGVKLILLGDGVIYDPNSKDYRLIYGFESLINEEYVINQSRVLKLAHAQKMQAKKLNRNNVTFGYVWSDEKNDIVIDPVESQAVKDMFDHYVFRGEGIRELQKLLSTHGFMRSRQSISKYLSETSYIGVFNMNKRNSELGIGVGQKTRRFDNPKEEWVRVMRPDLAFIEPEIFELAQKIKASRMKAYDADKKGIMQARFSGYHLYSNKLFCASCGSSYVHDYTGRDKTIPVYRDSFSQKTQAVNGKCPNPYSRLYESDLIDLTRTLINTLLSANKESFQKLMDILQRVFERESGSSAKKSSLTKRLKSLRKKMEKIRSSFIDMDQDNPLRIDLMKDYTDLSDEAAKIDRELSEVESEMTSQMAISSKLDNIRKALDSLQMTGITDIDRNTINIFIDKIDVFPEGILVVVLQDAAMISRKTKMPHDDTDSDVKRHQEEGTTVETQINIDCSGIVSQLPEDYLQGKIPLFSFSATYENGRKKYWNSVPRSFKVCVVMSAN